MMRFRIGLLLLVIAIGLAIVAPAVSQPDQFIIQNADGVSYRGMVSSGTLSALLAQVSPRFTISYANAVRDYDLTTVPAPLNTLLNNVSPRIMIAYANDNAILSLEEVPAALQTLLGQVLPKFTIAYANANEYYELVFPIDLIDDDTPPQASGVSATTVGPNSAVIAWTTDEFADSEVRYGTQPGNYQWTVTDPLYVMNHSITLTGLSEGATYYFIVRSTDQSGNTYQSGEHTFELGSDWLVFLPVTSR